MSSIDYSELAHLTMKEKMIINRVRAGHSFVTHQQKASTQMQILWFDAFYGPHIWMFGTAKTIVLRTKHEVEDNNSIIAYRLQRS